MHNHLKYERKLVFGDGDFPLNVATWQNHPDYPLHVHDFSEIVIVLSGTGVNVINEESFAIKAGDVFVLHGNRPHGFKHTNNLSIVNVIFDRSLLSINKLKVSKLPGYQALFEVEPALLEFGKFKRHLQLDFSQLTHVRALTDAMEVELNASSRNRPSLDFDDRNKNSELDVQPIDQGSHLIALGHFMVLIGTLSRWHAGKTIVDPQKTHKIGEVLSYMETHYHEPFDIEKVTQISGMSRRNFYRIFANITEKSPMSYLLHLRIARAAHLLQTTEKNVTEIAFECGFDDSNYFSRQFRKTMGMPPRAYKSQKAPIGNLARDAK
ncbi:helix-turn-helix domain-containing protein [Coraliomargarita sp. SDUM461004]|uniref:Helix-turn-helix domain-containing protein n=1 Tax=Thalassobacterium sedimentorum TaxID=3041258 RepID=A0ABU1AQU7_9BACT|nr:helix-turn-helix domain-containing protein [Coraliomargarita sp. SDUM461004]MDQ8195983.1 helix-turn-helix domain-containing protein [Coraliomargarita sp. SDUM461004]